MRETFAIKFYCREQRVKKDGQAPVEISLIVSGQREQWTLPKSCKPKDFPTPDIKKYLTAVEHKLNEIHTNLALAGEPITAYRIKDIYINGATKSYTIGQMFGEGMAIKEKENIIHNTYRKYRNICELFLRYTGKRKEEQALTVKYGDILTFRAKLEAEYHPQTASKMLQHLKWFFTLAFNSGKIPAHPFAGIKIKKYEFDKPYLTYEEISAIRDLQLDTDRLDRVRDIFLFLCFTGLEWADLKLLQKDDVKKNAYSQYYIKKPRVKTGVEYITILFEDARDIWDFYNGELPKMSPQKFNTYLKEIAEKAAIDKTCTSLTARHSFACYLLNNQHLEPQIVQKMMGHKTLHETYHYAKMFEEAVFKANKTSAATEHRATVEARERQEAEWEKDFEEILEDDL